MISKETIEEKLKEYKEQAAKLRAQAEQSVKLADMNEGAAQALEALIAEPVKVVEKESVGQ